MRPRDVTPLTSRMPSSRSSPSPRGAGSTTSPGSCFHHEAVFYGHGDDGFLLETLPSVDRALEEDGEVLVAVGPGRAAALKEALEGRADRLHFADIRRIGRNPARIISLWQRFVAERGDGPLLGIGEQVWPGRRPAELSECERHEALLNLAFDGGPAWRMLCAYDLDGLDDRVIEAAQCTHPIVVRDGSRASSAAFLGTHESPSPFAGALPPPSAPVQELSFAVDDLAELRRFIAAWGEEHSLPAEGGEELVLAVNELTTNSIRYGGGGGTLRLWRDDDTLLCEVQDGGKIEGPLVGRVRPTPDARSGRGVWIANHLCDLVQIRSTPTGTAVRVHKALAA